MLLVEIGVGPDDGAHRDVMDIGRRPERRLQLAIGVRVAAHIAHRDLALRRVARRDHRRDVRKVQADGLFEQHMASGVQRRDGRVGVVLVAVEHGDDVELLCGQHRVK